MSLLKLGRSDLPRLKELVEPMQPLLPSQVQALFDIVTHVYLTGEPYEHVDVGFMGMSMAQVFGDDDRGESDAGVIVQSRMPGLAAYGTLLEGDVILCFVEHRNEQLTNSFRLINIVRRYRPGDTLHLEIRRQGRQMTVPVTLSARPVEQLLMNAEEFDNDRMKQAEKYWIENYGTLVRPALSRAD